MLSAMKSHSFRTFVIDDTMRADHAAIIQDKLKKSKEVIYIINYWGFKNAKGYW